MRKNFLNNENTKIEGIASIFGKNTRSNKKILWDHFEPGLAVGT